MDIAAILECALVLSAPTVIERVSPSIIIANTYSPLTKCQVALLAATAEVWVLLAAHLTHEETRRHKE